MEEFAIHTSHGLQPAPPRKPSLLIFFLASAVFLLAAIGVGIWLVTKPGGTVQIFQPTGDGSESVKKVSFVAPANITDGYAKRDQNTHTAQTTYYLDTAASCGITTTVVPRGDTKTPVRQAVLDVIEAAKAQGITSKSVSDSPELKVKNADGQRTYSFPAIHIEQNVDVKGVTYNAQHTVAAYKQFGSSITIISYFCKSGSWDTKKTDMAALCASFMVKTEK